MRSCGGKLNERLYGQSLNGHNGWGACMIFNTAEDVLHLKMAPFDLSCMELHGNLQT